MTVAAEQGSADDLIRLDHPRGLALVGATETEGPGAQQTRRLMEIADAIGVQSYPISATRTEIFGRTAHRSLA
ncbi:hypothetical protein [Rhodococcus jostii]|uniref:Uncharacterized protein n=1 Tax=Rhodococcus jostii TaxID=132919 RepID=A0ABU4CRX8_RHOJO|nr:hypothetical protein [Rhodococcus jostii]MDV6285998.1 hypothetical protein [Rhodococcus jostii]